MDILQFFARYPASIICYLLFSLLCYRALEFNIEFQERLKHIKPGESGFALGGESMGSQAVSIVIFAGIFIFVCFANAIARKQNAFYLWLSGIIIVQTVILFQFMK